MKKIVLFISVLCFVGAHAQITNQTTNNNTSNVNTGVFGSPSNSLGLVGSDEGTLIINPTDIIKIEGFGSALDFDDIRLGGIPTDGTVLLFEDWNNRGVIEVEDKRYIFNNMNFHLVKSTFMSKIDNDSLVSFDLSMFNRIVINDLVFKSIYNPATRGKENFQIIYESPEVSLLKNYEIVVTEPEPNPMINRQKRKIEKKGLYYLKKGNSMRPFKFKKKNIAALAGDRSGEMIQYAKTNKLSFRDDKDVIKLLNIFMNN